MFNFLEKISKKREQERNDNIRKYHALVLDQIKFVQDIGNTCPNAQYSFAELFAAKAIVDGRIKNKKDLNEMYANLQNRNIDRQGLNISFLVSSPALRR